LGRRTVPLAVAISSGTQAICKGQLPVATEEQEAAAAGVAEKQSDQLNFDSAPIAGETNLICLNVVALGVSKETALRLLAAEYRVDMSEIVAVGTAPTTSLFLPAPDWGWPWATRRPRCATPRRWSPMMSRPMALPGCWKACLGAAGKGNYVAMSPRSSPGRPEAL